MRPFVASKRWVQIGFFDLTSTVNAAAVAVTLVNSTVSFVVNLDNISTRYLAVTFSETANAADITAVYLDATVTF